MIVLAWAIPVAWVVAAVFAGPSDGTTISNPSSFAGDQRWNESVTVVREYGETPLREGDLILAIDGRSLEDWVDGDASAERQLGDDVTYRVRRSGADLDRVLDLEVSLIRYPLGDALADNLSTTILVLGLLVSGTFLFWSRHARPPAGRSGRRCRGGGGADRVPPRVGRHRPGRVRGVWPHVGGELLCTLALGALLVAASPSPGRAPGSARAGAAWLVPFLVPLAATPPGRCFSHVGVELDLARLQALTMITTPALLLTAPVILLVEARGLAVARSREDRVALRLVLGGTILAVLVRVVFGDLAQWQRGQPLVPWDLQPLLLMPALWPAW